MQSLAATKDEIIYANLDHMGDVKNIYVVNRFESAVATTVTDHAPYGEVANLTNLEPLTASQGCVTFPMEAGTFYYQGTVDALDLPWQFGFTYRLNGRTIDTASLAGQSGLVEIDLDIRQNAALDPVYYENYALQMSVTLDTDTCTDIEASGATQANQGTQKVLSYTVLPESEKTFTIRFHTTAFALDPITINAVPLAIDVDSIDTTEMKEKVTELQDGIEQVATGVSALKKATQALDSGASSLSDASGAMATGIGSLTTASGQLVAGSSRILSAMDQLSIGLHALNESAKQVAGGGSELVSGAAALESGLVALKGQFALLSASASDIGKAIDSLHDASSSCSSDIDNINRLISVVSGTEIAEDYGKYIASARKIIATLEGLSSSLGELQGEYAKFQAGLDACASALTELATATTSLKNGASTYTSGVGQLTNGITQSGMAESSAQLAEQYAQFDAAVQGMQTGLMSLNGSYTSLHAGIEAISGNTGKLKSGASKLKRGTGELSDETADIDQQIDDEIDNALKKFDNEDFEPVSFADARNQVRLVQFVIKTEAIEIPEETIITEPEPEAEPSFGDRLKALFA